MKKLICIILSALFLVGMLPVSAFADNGSTADTHDAPKRITSASPSNVATLEPATATSGYYHYSVSYGKATITGCDELISGAVTIPSTLGGYPVTSIGFSAFEGCTGMTSVTIPDSVTSIENYAFEGCTGLTSITIPDSVKSIGNGAFYGCRGLTSITIPDSVTSIGSYAFYKCTGLTSVTIGKGVTRISDYAFEGCTGLTSVTIPDSVTSIDFSAFEGCTGLTSITIGKGVTSIGNLAFYNCTGLTSITIGKGVTSIGNHAFHYCTGLTSVTIPDSVKSIGYSAFYKCTGLTSITIGKGVTRIEYSAFEGCTGLTRVNITDIGAWCGISFSSYSNPLYYAHKLYLNGKLVTNLVIPDSVTSIGNAAFYNCTGLTSITIPDSVTIIGGYAFQGCTGLTSVTIPDSVTSIGSYAFSYCTGLTSITIGKGVTSIGDRAFYQCYALNHVFYGGTKTQWYNDIVIQEGNDKFSNATRHYNCDESSYSIETISPTCSDRGYTELYCSICKEVFKNNFTDPTGIHTYNIDGKCNDCGCFVQSFHNYENNTDKTWTIKRNGATEIKITFDSQTNLESGCDFLYIYDRNDKQVGKYTGTELANKSVTISGDTAKIRLVTDEFDSFYGFALTNIEFKEPHIQDIPADSWYTEPCLWCNANGYITGTTATAFNPNGKLTRAMFVQILAKVDGVDLASITYNGKFTDVKSNNWFAKAVQWAVDCGVTGGTGANTFSPNTAVTREQLATFFFAYAKYKGYDISATVSLTKYKDASTISSWAKNAVTWAVAEGLISGTSETTVSPKTSATRAQAAVIFKNFVENYVAKQK